MPITGSFRPLTDAERELLSTLLGTEFPGQAELVTQATTALARVIDPEGSLELLIMSDDRAAVVRRIPVEAELEDADGVTIHLLLHVVDGLLNELEIFREDSQPLQASINPRQLRLIVL